MTNFDISAIRSAHPGLDQGMAERTAETYAWIASRTFSTVGTMAKESRLAETRSEVGLDLAT